MQVYTGHFVKCFVFQMTPHVGASESESAEHICMLAVECCHGSFDNHMRLSSVFMVSPWTYAVWLQGPCVGDAVKAQAGGAGPTLPGTWDHKLQRAGISSWPGKVIRKSGRLPYR